MLEALSSKLSKYLSPQLYRSIFSGEQDVSIASKRKKLTVFFSDIAAFTETTDNLESEDLTDVLNHYLTEMSAIALKHGATIDKFIGDAMLIFFGDPETRGVKEDAKACVLMALEMQRRMRELEHVWRDRGLERPFRIRMGISTGFCTVGNFGSQDRMDYTIIGNEVNLAARLESSAEPGSILLAHETNALVQDIVLTEEQPPITVKGFLRAINTYKIVGAYDELVESGKIVMQERDGLRVLVDLSKQDRSEAIKILEEVLAQLKS
jgi:class 3 adenylate cyclase